MHPGKVAAPGTGKEPEASLGGNRRLNDVFVRYAGGALDSGAALRSESAERAAERRLG
jgi:hypothetical protein